MAVDDAGDLARSAPVDAVVAEFRRFLSAEGLAAETVRGYGNHAVAFLTWMPDPVDVALAGLSGGQVTGYVVEYCRGGRNSESAKAMVTALRSLLRFLHVTGRVPTSLVGAVPAVANWRLAGLPRTISAEQVDALIAGCDEGIPVAVRDRSLLVLLARLGLRTVEAAALQLEDVDWRSGQILIRGRGNRVERLPLPNAVGEAPADYLTRTRPVCAAWSMFLTVRGRPSRPLTAMAVRQIFARACGRAVLPRLGAHRLRHTLASDLLRAGNSLPQIGRCCATAASCPQRSTPRSTPSGCGTWPDPGQASGDRHDRHGSRGWVAAGGPGVRGHPTGAGLHAVHAGSAAAGLRRLLRAARRRHGDHGRGAGVGDRHGPQPGSVVVGSEAYGGADLRPASAGPGSGGQVPPTDVLPQYRRITPYLYSPQQLADLVQAAGRLRPRLRGLTYAAVSQ